VVRLVFATREPDRFGLPEVASQLAYGASPRATLGLVAAGRALALLRGRDYVLPADILDIAPDVLAHRLVLSFDAVADEVRAEDIIRRVLEAVPLPMIAPSQEDSGPGMGPGLGLGIAA
jgi:MoxR-like ATPase